MVSWPWRGVGRAAEARERWTPLLFEAVVGVDAAMFVALWPGLLTEFPLGHFIASPHTLLRVSYLASRPSQLGSLAPNLFDLSLKHLANIARHLVLQNLPVML